MRLIQWRCNPNPQTYRQIMVMESCNHMEVLLNAWENTNYVDLQSDLSFHIFSIEFSHAATFFGRLQHTKSRVGWCRHAPNDLVCRGWYSHSTARLTDLQYWSILRIWETLRDCGTISSLYIYIYTYSHIHTHTYIYVNCMNHFHPWAVHSQVDIRRTLSAEKRSQLRDWPRVGQCYPIDIGSGASPGAGEVTCHGGSRRPWPEEVSRWRGRPR